MIHIRIDDHDDNSKRRFECGIGPELPPGDKYFFPGEALHLIDCPGCLHGQPQHQLGTPLSEVSGRLGTRGYSEFVRISESWGYQ